MTNRDIVTREQHLAAFIVKAETDKQLKDAIRALREELAKRQQRRGAARYRKKQQQQQAMAEGREPKD